MDVHIYDNYGWTPLHYAVSCGYLEVSLILLKHNAEVNSRADHRSTPLLLASEDGTPDVVQLLLDHSADVYSMCTMVTATHHYIVQRSEASSR